MPKPKKKVEKTVIGRPTSYKPEYCKRAAEMCQNGATVAELADEFEVSIPTVYSWMNKYAPFLKAVVLNKETANERVTRSLYHRSVGYTFDSEKIFMPAGGDGPVRVPTKEHVPPEVGAIKFWLINRQPDQWRERLEHIVAPGAPKTAEERRQEFLNFIVEYGLQEEIAKLLPMKVINGIANRSQDE